MIHEIAEEFDLNHSSRVVNDKRVLVLTKPELRDFVNAPTFNGISYCLFLCCEMDADLVHW